MTPAAFIRSLADYTGTNVFNPWRNYDPVCDISPQAPQIRRNQLTSYLSSRLEEADFLIIAEAAGYQGCRFTGIALTCERMLLGFHKTVTASAVLDRAGIRTSRPNGPYMTSDSQRHKGMNEPTDTYVWNALIATGLDTHRFLLWNIFPFHPYKKTSPFSNRTPTEKELAVGLSYTKDLLTLCKKNVHIAAVGRKSAETLQAAGLNATAMRHPANGGGNTFKENFSAWMKALITPGNT